MFENMLATSLLEGYEGNDWNMSSNLDGVVDPIAYLQEACIEFTTGVSDLCQQFYMADIVGQSKVITEGLEPQVVLEMNIKSAWDGFKKLIGKLIDRLKQWAKNIRAWIKSKFSKKKDKDNDAKIDALKDEDKILIATPSSEYRTKYTKKNKQPLQIPMKGEQLTIPMIAYDLDKGDDFCNTININLRDMLDDLSPSEDFNTHQDMRAYEQSNIETEIERRIGFKYVELSNEIKKAYNADGKPISTPITGDIISTSEELLKGIGTRLEDATAVIDKLTGILETMRSNVDNVTRYFNNNSVVTANMTNSDFVTKYCDAVSLITNTIIASVRCSMSVYESAKAQSDLVISTAIEKGIKESVTEGVDPEESDPPSGDEEFIEEGVNIDAFKKYFYDCRDLIKNMKKADKLYGKEDYTTAKKEYASIKSGLKKVYDDLSNMNTNDITDDFKSIPMNIVTNIVIGFDSFIQNAWLNKTMRDQDDIIAVQKDTSGSKNVTITSIMSKINACIKRCDRQIDACTKKMKKGVSEGYSIWDQAAKYI